MTLPPKDKDAFGLDRSPLPPYTWRMSGHFPMPRNRPTLLVLILLLFMYTNPITQVCKVLLYLCDPKVVFQHKPQNKINI